MAEISLQEGERRTCRRQWNVEDNAEICPDQVNKRDSRVNIRDSRVNTERADDI